LREQFEAAANSPNVLLREDALIEFPERDVVLAFSDLVTLGRLMTRTDAIAEIRLANDSPAVFLAMNNLRRFFYNGFGVACTLPPIRANAGRPSHLADAVDTQLTSG